MEIQILVDNRQKSSSIGCTVLTGDVCEVQCKNVKTVSNDRCIIQ